MLGRRRALALEFCLDASLRIQKQVVLTREFEKAASIALYSPILNEVYTEEIFRAAQESGKELAYPRVTGSVIEFARVLSREDLRPGAFGILEPVGSDLIAASNLDLILVPGVAFDRTGHRLGFGKGFYDRILHNTNLQGRRLGLCFELQLVDRLPAESHDIHMNLIVTEKNIYRFGNHLSDDVPQLFTGRT